MISRTPVAVGAILLFQTISLGSNNAVHANESGKLRRRLSAEEKQDERDLAPFGFGQGYGYTRNSNRYSYQRTRGGVLGAQVLRPYEPDASQPYRGPNRNNNIFDPPPPPPSFAGAATGGPPKVGKSKAAKASKKDYYDRPVRINNNPPPPPPRGVGGVPPPPQGSGSVTREGDFADAFTWTRVPGQPLFISQTETPIIVLDVPFQVGFDEDGNFFLVDQEGKEITVVFNDEDGTFSVVEEVRPPIISFDDKGNWLIRPRDQVTRDPTSKPTERETSTMPPTLTTQPTATPQPTEFCTNDEDFFFNTEDNNCEFVSNNPDVRCEIPGASESCRLSCNEQCETDSPTKQVTNAPTASPSDLNCIDDPDFRINDNDNQDCVYVAVNAEVRCTRTGAADACPSVCNENCA